MRARWQAPERERRQPEPGRVVEPLGREPGAAEAEQYAAIYPERAALIRRLGRVPDDASFGPPDDGQQSGAELPR